MKAFTITANDDRRNDSTGEFDKAKYEMMDVFYINSGRKSIWWKFAILEKYKKNK